MSITQTEFKTQISDGSRKLYGYLASTDEDSTHIFGAKRIYKTDIYDCTERNDWVYGTVYSYYESSLTSASPKTFYVNTFQNGVHKVFKCLDNYNGSPSTTDPFSITRFEPIRLNDGYVWILMYQFTDMNYRKFSSESVIPIANDPIVSAKARPGIIHNVVVTNGGAGYTTAVVSIIGANNIEARAIPIIKNGKIDRIDVTDVGNGYLTGATVTIVGDGVGASAIIPTAPVDGHGYNAKAELFCESVAVSVSMSEDTDYDAIPYGLKYNRFGLLQDISLSSFRGDYRIKYIDIPEGGSDYDTLDKPVVSFTGGFDVDQTETESGTAYAVATDERIVSTILTKRGKEYRHEPTVAITHPRGSGATHTIAMESMMPKNLNIMKIENVVGEFAVGEIVTNLQRTAEANVILVKDNYLYYKLISGSFSGSTRLQGLSSNANSDIVFDNYTRKDFVTIEDNVVLSVPCHTLTRQEDQPERLHFVIKF